MPFDASMLDTIAIACPKCQQPTEIAVSRSEGGGMTGTTTACRCCFARFITFTQPDGTVVILDGDDPPDLTKNEPVTAVAIVRPLATKSGYRVRPPQHLGIFDRGGRRPLAEPGVSDEGLATNAICSDSQVLRRPDGSPRSPAEAAKFVGWRTVWVAQLNEALAARLSGPPPLSFPPGIFISYRWGSDADNAWAMDLARDLKARGYPVTFDRDEPKDLDVPRMVSKVADARYFVALLDSGYAERIDGGKDGWVFDEYNTAAHLALHGQIRILGFLRSGAALPQGFSHPRPGVQGNTLDVRTPEQLKLVLDDLFPPIENAPDEHVVDLARAFLRESHEHLLAGRFDDAMESASDLTALLPGVIDGPAQKVRVALAAGLDYEGLASAEEALALAPGSRELLLAAGSFATGAGEPQRAIAHLGLLLETYDEAMEPDIAQAHLALGSALDDVDQVYAGIAHLEISRRMAPQTPEVRNMLGFLYRRAGTADRALACFDEALTLNPNYVEALVNRTATLLEEGRIEGAHAALVKLATAAPKHPSVSALGKVLAGSEAGGTSPILVARVPTPRMDRWAHCDKCAARIPLEEDRDVLCARCGSSLSPRQRVCPLCGSDGRVFPAVSTGLARRCPFCRKGRITAT
jgi:tetratricopeptide (TPR) repeat protein